MPVSRVQLINGYFEDSEGNPLALGYLLFELIQNTSVNGFIVCAGSIVKILLDVNGNIAANQYIWGNDQMSPINSFYRVTGYSASGQIVFGPNNQQVMGNGGTFDLSNWVPNQIVWS